MSYLLQRIEYKKCCQFIIQYVHFLLAGKNSIMYPTIEESVGVSRWLDSQLHLKYQVERGIKGGSGTKKLQCILGNMDHLKLL